MANELQPGNQNQPNIMLSVLIGGVVMAFMAWLMAQLMSNQAGVSAQPAFQAIAPVLQVDSPIPTPVAANTNLLSDDITPSYEASYLEVQVMSDTTTVLSAVITHDGTTTVWSMNGSNPMYAGAGYNFTIMVSSADTVNFRVADAAKVGLKVMEVLQ